MKNKHWLAAVLIISLLAIVYFWDGNHQESTVRVESSTRTLAVNSPDSHKAAGTRNNDEYNGQTDINKGITDENVIGSGTKEKASMLPDKFSEAEKAAAITEEKPEKALINKKQEDPSQKEQAAVEKSSANKTEKVTSNTGSKKDKYLTDPVPEGKPKPVEWQTVKVKKEKQSTCTLSVTCKTILENMGSFNKDKLEVLPMDGIIYKTRKVTFHEGESVFDVLLREMKGNRIHMEFEMTPIYNSNYIEGINNIYEFDCGELSGWMYSVNGWFPNYGCSRYVLKDGDAVEWIYTCDLGRDIGGGTAVGGKG